MEAVSSRFSIKSGEFQIDPTGHYSDPFLIGTTADGINVRGCKLLNGSFILHAYLAPATQGLPIGSAEYGLCLRAPPKESTIFLRQITNETGPSVSKIPGVGLALIRGLVALATAQKVTKIITDVITNHGFFGQLGFVPEAQEVALFDCFPLAPPEGTMPQASSPKRAPDPFLDSIALKRKTVQLLATTGLLTEVPDSEAGIIDLYRSLLKSPPTVCTTTLVAACRETRARSLSGQATARSRAESGGTALGAYLPAGSPTSLSPYNECVYSGSGAGRSLSRSGSTPLIVSVRMILPINRETFSSLPINITQLRAVVPTVSPYLEEALEMGLPPVQAATSVRGVKVGQIHAEAIAAREAPSAHPSASAAPHGMTPLTFASLRHHLPPDSEEAIPEEAFSKEDDEDSASAATGAAASSVVTDCPGGWDLRPKSR